MMKYANSFKTLFFLGGVASFIGCGGPSENESAGTSGRLADSSTQVQAPNEELETTDLPSGSPLSNNPEVDIHSAYSRIMRKKNGGNLDSTTFKYSCYNEKSGRVAYFSEQGKLKLITHSYNEYDHFSAEDQYFIEDGQLYFVYQKTVTWAFESGPEGSTKDNIIERRMYLAGNKPIKCLQKKFTIRSQSADNPTSEQVPNKAVDCNWGPEAEKKFKLLEKYHGRPAPKCLE